MAGSQDVKLNPERWAAAVPPGMRALPRWCGWKGSKQPLDPRTSLPARVNDPETFGTFADALAFYTEHFPERDAGCGFVFTPGDGLVFLDLDHCLDPSKPNRPALPWAEPLSDTLRRATYVEVSPSGSGLHAFILGDLPRAEGVSGARVEVGTGAVEAYAERRFSTVTGRSVGGHLAAVDLDILPSSLLAKLRRVEPEHVSAPQGPEPLNRRREVWAAMQHLDPDMSNDDWVKVGMALKSAFGDEGLALWVKWSSKGAKYRRGEPEQRWRSFRRAGVGLGTLFKMARASGWAPPQEGPEEAFADFARGDVWTTPLSEVEDETLDWLVRDLGLVRGYASLMAGDGGLGKSTVTLDVAARLTRGLPMPWEKEPTRAPCRVYYMNAEDGQGDTIKPRARAAGADLSRIEVLDVSGGSRVPQLPEDVPLLERMLSDLGDAQLVVIDPLNAFLGREVDAHKAHDIRQALQPLSDLLRRTRRAVQLVAHLNKNETVSALYRVSGSADQVMFVRTAMLLGTDPDADEDDSSRRVLAPLKWNLGKPPPSRGFRLVESGIPDVGRVEWGEESDSRAEDVVRRPEGRTSSGRLAECEAWLRSRLSAEAVPSRVLEEQARDAGFPRATLNRCAARMGLHRERDLVTGGWRWPKVESFKEEKDDHE